MARPTDVQVTGVLAEARDLIQDLAADAAQVLSRARSGGAPVSAVGFPPGSGGGGGGRGSVGATPTEAAADRFFPRVREDETVPEGERGHFVVAGAPVGLGADPVRADALLMGQLIKDAVDLLRRADGCRRSVVTNGVRPRGSTVELCAECEEPAPRVKRLDGRPYHYPEPGVQCWWHAYRRRQSGGAPAAPAQEAA